LGKEEHWEGGKWKHWEREHWEGGALGRGEHWEGGALRRGSIAKGEEHWEGGALGRGSIEKGEEHGRVEHWEGGVLERKWEHWGGGVLGGIRVSIIIFVSTFSFNPMVFCISGLPWSHFLIPTQYKE